ncbi:MAG: hypothetical protein JXA42_09155 [Anaerolineales bacterium]|nr:hypothetical protein [Anaerolineales bacterium]
MTCRQYFTHILLALQGEYLEKASHDFQNCGDHPKGRATVHGPIDNAAGA